jgi:5-formyltetrahydrofolate cyclo-ligase
MPKRVRREQLLDYRRSLPSDFQVRSGGVIQATFISLSEYLAADTIAVYASCQGEVPTSTVIRNALAAGKKVLLPVVTTGGILFRPMTDESKLVPGAFGILEPNAKCPAFDLSMIDLFVIPGVAFDLSGRRIGYGRGYYDRALHRLEGGGRFIGFCYDFQLVDEIVGEPHDVIMDRVITERRVITTALRK